MEVGWDSDACETVLFDENASALRCTVLEARAEPRVDVAWDVDGCCSDEVVPSSLSVIEPAPRTDAVTYQEVSV
jgi:hypothetical protein